MKITSMSCIEKDNLKQNKKHTNNTYQTDTNMAQSQSRQIATQSSLKFVNEWAVSCNQCLTLKEIISITNVVVDYIENGYSKELGERLTTIDNYLKNEK